MNEHIPFPKIKQFHQVLRGLKESLRTAKSSYVTVSGYPKIHGTNAGIVFTPSGEVYFQSRNKIITVGDDNEGMARFFTDTVDGKNALEALKESIHNTYNVFAEGATIVVYGEWCGKGILTGTAINTLDRKIFIAFAIKIIFEDGTSLWSDVCSMKRTNTFLNSMFVYNIAFMPRMTVSSVKTVTFDVFDNFSIEQALKLMNEWVDEIDKSCPVGKFLGVEGPGEGYVFTIGMLGDMDHAFKVKGESHTKSKIGKRPAINPVVLDSAKLWVEQTCTIDRLEQMFDLIENPGYEKTGEFVKMVRNDILTEEGDSLEASGVDIKVVNKELATKASQWFLRRLNK